MTELVDIGLSQEQQEGTTAVVQTWLKSPGDVVSAHEPVVELETDKVVVELAAPEAGVLIEIVKQEGEEVFPGDVVGRIDPGQTVEHEIARAEVVPSEVTPGGAQRELPVDEVTGRSRLSPVVRRLVREHSLNPDQLTGTGKGGRISVRDVHEFLQERGEVSPILDASKTLPAEDVPGRAASAATPESPVDAPTSRSVPLDNIRKRIADHMVTSLLHTAPHVTSVFELDLSTVIAHRARHKQALLDRGVNLTFTAYFVAASTQALQHVPQVNSRFHQDRLEFFDDINIGVGTALQDKGLVVPVLHRVQHLNLSEIATRLHDLTGKAREGQLAPQQVRGGTFTISNHGVSGSLLASPIIINQPQSAILGIGKLEKRVVVRAVDGHDSIQVRPMCYVTLTIDHRVLDAYQTNKFLAKFVEVLENWG